MTRTKILYIPIFACACDWSQNPSIIFYSTTGDTYRSLHLYISQFEDDFACVGCREIPKKRFRLHLLLSSLIDDHNKKLQNIMNLNKFCPAKKCSFRLLTTFFGMCVANFYHLYLNSIKTGATTIQYCNVRTFSDFICHKLSGTNNKPLYTFIRHRVGNEINFTEQLVRITDRNGQTNIYPTDKQINNHKTCGNPITNTCFA